MNSERNWTNEPVDDLEVGGHNIFQVFMVTDDFNEMRGTDEPEMHITKGVDDCEEFLVIDFAIDFGGSEFTIDWISISCLVVE